METFSEGSPTAVIDSARTSELLDQMLAALGPLQRVLLIPPDITRLPSGAGQITVQLYEKLRDHAHVEIMPALGTHAPMTPAQLRTMFPGIPGESFRIHDWRHALTRLGEVPAGFVAQVSGGKLDYPIFCEVNRLLAEGNWDRIISIGQVVPHEVVGLANHNKNIFVGVGGQDTINKTHFLGAVHGMERLMGQAASPVRKVLDCMEDRFARDLPISYVLTVRSKDATGQIVTRGLFGGDDRTCFHQAADLCRQVNLDLLDEPPRKFVVYLDPAEFHSTWLGNKAIYRTRMAIADGGEVLILAPGVNTFGEDATIDALIRKYGYRGTPHTLEMVRQNADLTDNLSAAAHLIHGSSEDRFRIRYCPGGLRREEVEAANFEYAGLASMLERYDPAQLADGHNVMPNGEKIFYVSNPALGLWGLKSSFAEQQSTR